MKEKIKKQLDKLKLPCCQMFGKIYVELPREKPEEAQQKVIEAVGDMGETRRWNEMGAAWVIVTPRKAEKEAPKAEEKPLLKEEQETPA